MSFITDNVLPGKKGKIFSTNAESDEILMEVVYHVKQLDGVTRVNPIKDSYPREFVVHADDKVSVEEVQDKSKEVNVHALVKGYLEE